MACRRRAFRSSPSRSSISRAWAWAAASLHSQADYEQMLTPGHMWMTLLDGPPCQLRRRGGRRRAALVAPCHRRARRGGHVRLLDGACRARSGDRGLLRRLDRAASRAAIPASSISRPSAARMIEVHLRLSDQWPDLYGAGWVDALVRLYHRAAHGTLPMHDRRDGYSVVLFGPHGPALSPPAAPRWSTQVQRSAGRLQRADHLPRGQANPSSRHAAGRLPARHRQCLESASRACAGRDMLRAHFLARAA